MGRHPATVAPCIRLISFSIQFPYFRSTWHDHSFLYLIDHSKQGSVPAFLSTHSLVFLSVHVTGISGLCGGPEISLGYGDSSFQTVLPPVENFSRRNAMQMLEYVQQYHTLYCAAAQRSMVYYYASWVVWYGMVWYGMVWYGMVGFNFPLDISYVISETIIYVMKYVMRGREFDCL